MFREIPTMSDGKGSKPVNMSWRKCFRQKHQQNVPLTLDIPLRVTTRKRSGNRGSCVAAFKRLSSCYVYAKCSWHRQTECRKDPVLFDDSNLLRVVRPHSDGDAVLTASLPARLVHCADVFRCIQNACDVPFVETPARRPRVRQRRSACICDVMSTSVAETAAETCALWRQQQPPYTCVLWMLLHPQCRVKDQSIQKLWR